MWTGRGSWGRGWGFLVHRAKQQKGKLKGQLQCAQDRLMTCRPAGGPHLVADRLRSLDSRILGKGVHEPKGGALEKAQVECPPGKLSPLRAGPIRSTVPDLAGPETDSASNALLASQASPDKACRLPPPAGAGWQQPHRGCPFKSLPPLIVWTNRGPCPPGRGLPPTPTSPQKCEGHLKGQQRGSRVSNRPRPHPKHTHRPFRPRHIAPCPSRGPPKFRFSPHP